MQKYNLKTDIKQIGYIFTLIFSVLFIFSIFSLVIIFPLYYYSKAFTKIYSIFASLFFILVTGFFVAKWGISIRKKYKNLKTFFIKILLSPLSTVSVLLLLCFEFMIFKLLEVYTPVNFETNFIAHLLQLIIYITTGSLILINIFFTSSLLILIIEICSFRILFELLPIIPAIILLVLLNLIIITGIFFLRILIHNINSYLKNNENI